MNITALIIAIVVLVGCLALKITRELFFDLFRIHSIKIAAKKVKDVSVIEKGYIVNSYALTYMSLVFFIVFEVYAFVNFFMTIDPMNLIIMGALLLLIMIARLGVWLNFKFAGISLIEETEKEE